VHLSEILPVDC